MLEKDRAADEYPVLISDVQQAVCEHYQIERIDLLSSRRTKALAFARQVSCYLAKMLTTKSMPEIGRRTGDRDNTTVRHAARKIAALVAADEQFAASITSLSEKARAVTRTRLIHMSTVKIGNSGENSSENETNQHIVVDE
jgi:chromosomal replication initiation ATPase DnaA